MRHRILRTRCSVRPAGRFALEELHTPVGTAIGVLGLAVVLSASRLEVLEGGREELYRGLLSVHA